TPIIPEGYGSSWAQYTIQLESRAQRDAVQEQLKQQGIPTMVYYPKPMHTQLAFADLPYDGSCPVTERLCDTVLALPMHPYLTEKQAEEVAVALLTALKK
ncbi:MAG: DegT/DnrJ/EryC1/StrS family aminotransferase, partial [Oscillospiraceae bacterium]